VGKHLGKHFAIFAQFCADLRIFQFSRFPFQMPIPAAFTAFFHFSYGGDGGNMAGKYGHRRTGSFKQFFNIIFPLWVNMKFSVPNAIESAPPSDGFLG
jgi:hypothetical protein